MTALVWDKLSERTFQTGVDRGVLYLQDDDETSVVWNGITSVEEIPGREVSSQYLNGLKFLEYSSPGDFSATLKAFTYPDEFDTVNGILKSTAGLRIYDQPSKRFGLSYRTKIGNAIDGIDASYLIHLIYNVMATPDSSLFSNFGESLDPIEFAWTLSAIPVSGAGVTWRPTAHLSIDSREISEEVLHAFEAVLYGTDSDPPHLPTIAEIPGLLADE